MNWLAVKLGYFQKSQLGQKSKLLKLLVDLIGIEPTTSCMPCRTTKYALHKTNISQVIEFTMNSESNTCLFLLQKSAHNSSKAMTIVWVAGGKIGVKPENKIDRNFSARDSQADHLSSVTSAYFITNNIVSNKTKSGQIFGGRNDLCSQNQELGKIQYQGKGL